MKILLPYIVEEYTVSTYYDRVLVNDSYDTIVGCIEESSNNISISINSNHDEPGRGGLTMKEKGFASINEAKARLDFILFNEFGYRLLNTEDEVEKLKLLL